MKNFTFHVRTMLFVALLVWQAASYGQISYGGSPLSFQSPGTLEKATVRLPAPDMVKIQAEDLYHEQNEVTEPLRMAVSVMAGITMDNAGKWTTLADGSKSWLLSIHIKDALALGVYYDQFYLPEGSQLFLYNKDKNQLLGAYNNLSNPETGLFSTEFVQGDDVTLEYHQESWVEEKAVISISEIAYAYRLIQFQEREAKGGRSLYCMIDVACSEGANWQNQIRGVARISIKIGGNYYWCSGSLINNTSNNRTPYFLTAGHCGGAASASDLNQWIFYFNYQAPTCGGSGSGTNTMTGCQLKARDASAGDNGSDFYLVQFNSAIPNFFNVYYNGWNRTNTTDDMGNGVSIHHPAGDIKKISTYSTPLVSSTAWNGLPTHWRVTWASTANGRSIVEGGSSGSPIFDANGLICGDLTGGYTYNSCENPSPSFYGKIWYSWDQNGSTPAARLRDWLDPTNIGTEKLPGLNWQPIPPTADFETDTPVADQGEGIYFTDLSGPGILTWSWTFTGGTPETSTDENPGPIVYTVPGTYTVSLTVTNADGTDTETKTNYITINAAAPPVADFEADNAVIEQGSQVQFSDLSQGNPYEWYWEFEGGSPATSTEQNPTVSYLNAGTFDVSLRVVGYGGEDQKVVTDYITVNAVALPVADFVADQTIIMQGETVNFTDLSTGDPNYWYWEFEGGTPDYSEAQNPQGILYADGGAFRVALTVVNNYGINNKIVEDYIIVNWVGLNEYSKAALSAFPNPSNGNFRIFVQSDEVSGKLSVYNQLGKQVVYNGQVQLQQPVSIDLTQQPAGIYLLVVETPSGLISGKVSLLK
ncbi:MAG: PKD domain-containing protein [Bacteroidales bacterium]|nr:PKD domain-containing protein [Bacteroidales bacterium]